MHFDASSLQTEDTAALAKACLQHLSQLQRTVACAESCTGGQLCAQITALPGASAVFRGGMVSYWTEVKAQVLGVPQEILSRCGAVSSETALAMAEQIRRLTGADFGLSVTGVAGPDCDERGNPVGLVYVGFSSSEETLCRTLTLGDLPRNRIQRLSVAHALDLLLSRLPADTP